MKRARKAYRPRWVWVFFAGGGGAWLDMRQRLNSNAKTGEVYYDELSKSGTDSGRPNGQSESVRDGS